ncbi:hypothetical protein PHYBLDRAFT_153569 [Phycomyces blakesleeanus NRRL 1555(-)]|uniref:DDE Tnp4 domain-containing protein n=1 Tax=Phycomyces blakesleeanus (strain ATCC 8743b / DSM 1359 / FGSC 10004 / NBRC 33097 / NRRL 1555) TaxID=763407 RepID=A0A162W8D7_PHYB8|nr:hypothetical protein PHYBLDRAFT_153569 [Phycomyces blakesleeanus NRRL 1555(-)]OAD65325.1 hypothetical protein PHYBLDRAFT_153569 [Phycomyces blakesleeanus NRRL 1555(-)]|eukprot:XP_018283365.1 hypothetical protein PHYBLDRAFT_153569 [Phycomyces blakesleeanus NRRL 1555(-)]
MAYSARLNELAMVFGKDKDTLSIIFNSMLDKLMQKFGSGLYFDQNQFCKENLQIFSEAIHTHNGTFHKTTRPGDFQQIVFMHMFVYRHHGLRYQAVVTPDGITSSFYGPIVGRHHDLFVYKKSRLEDRMQEMFDFRGQSGSCYCLYGDRAYTNSQHIKCPFSWFTQDTYQRFVNDRMSKVHVVVENEFAHVANLFAFVKYPQSQQMFLSPVGTYYIVVASPILEEYVIGLLRN